MSREVCTCLGISEDDIKKAIKDGATTVEAVEEATGAGSVCGGCKDDIQDIMHCHFSLLSSADNLPYR